MKYDAVIFDLDGTLLNTLDDLCDSVNFALKAHGLPERTLLEVRDFVGNGIKNLVVRSAGEGVSDSFAEEILSTFKEHYSAHSADKTRPYDGVIEILEKLRERGVKTAVVSNKVDSAVKALVEKYFKGLIDVAIGELEGVSRKPAPDTVFLAMEKLSCSSAVYVGDSEVDVQTAKNASLDGVFVTWGFRDLEDLTAAGANVIVSRADELWEVLS